MGASLVIGVDGDDARLAMSKRMGADVTLDFRQVDVVEEVNKLTGGGVDVAIARGSCSAGRRRNPEFGVAK